MAKKEDLSFDLIIAGGGAAGLCGAVAAAKKYPRLRIGIVEKEVRVGKRLLPPVTAAVILPTSIPISLNIKVIPLRRRRL